MSAAVTVFNVRLAGVTQVQTLAGFKHLDNTQKNPSGSLGVKPIEKNRKNSATNLIQFLFVTSVIIKDFCMFTGSYD